MSRLDFSKSTAWIALIVTVMIVGSIVILCRANQPMSVPAELVEAPRPGHLAPEFTLTTTTGETSRSVIIAVR